MLIFHNLRVIFSRLFQFYGSDPAPNKQKGHAESQRLSGISQQLILDKCVVHPLNHKIIDSISSVYGGSYLPCC